MFKSVTRFALFAPSLRQNLARSFLLAAASGVGSLPVVSPAFAAAAGKPFFSLYNTDLVVAIAFILFVGLLIYFRVPGRIVAYLDARAAQIRAELEEARRLREEAQELRASFERKRQTVHEQVERIIAKARANAEAAAEQAKAEIVAATARRLRAAEERIAAAEAAAIREIRETAVRIATAAAGEVIAASLKPAQVKALITQSIDEVEKRLH